MTKRISLRERRDGDAKGIDSIFQSNAPEPEKIVPEEEPATESGAVLNRSQATESTSSSLILPSSEVEPIEISALESKPALSKVTVYIRPEQIIAVEAIQLAERRRSGKKPDKSGLMQEALDLLIEKYSTM